MAKAEAMNQPSIDDGLGETEQARSVLLEDQITSAFMVYSAARTPRARQRAWRQFSELVAKRSPEQITRMERARGLAP